MEQAEQRAEPISNDPFSPLEVELMAFQHMPGKRAVSLIKPGNAFSSRVRLINMSPQTALNLFSWLDQNRTELELLAKEQAK